MKGLLIETLGVRTLLVFGTEHGKLPLLQSAPKSDAILYMSGCTHEVCEGYSVSETDSGERGRLLRALWVYLFCIRGFPYGEYDFIINGIKSTLTYDALGNKQFAENVGKCKLLLSNSAKYAGIEEIEFYELLLGKYYFRIYACENAECVDIAALGGCICRRQTENEPPRATLALSRTGGGEVKLREYRFGIGEASPDALAFGAAAGFLFATQTAASPCRLSHNLGEAYAELCPCGDIVVRADGFWYQFLEL